MGGILFFETLPRNNRFLAFKYRPLDIFGLHRYDVNPESQVGIVGAKTLEPTILEEMAQTRITKLRFFFKYKGNTVSAGKMVHELQMN